MTTYAHRDFSGRPSRRALALAALASLCLVAVGVLHAASARAAGVVRIHNGDADIATLILAGQIVPGDLARLQGAVAKLPVSQRIVLLLESSGGDLIEAYAIGRFVYTSRIATVAIEGPGCHSACSMIFLAGRGPDDRPLRIMMKGARVGFHQGRLGPPPGQAQPPSSPDKSPGLDVDFGVAYGQNLIKGVDSYLREIKADSEFLTLVLSATNRTVTLLNEFDALRLGIHVMDPATQKVTTPGEFKR